MYTKEQANTLTPAGFYRYYQSLIATGLKRNDAYEQTETVHQDVDLKGRRKYNDLSSFHVQAYREKQKEN